MFAPQRRLSETIDNPDLTECAKTKCRCGLDAALKVSSSGRKYLGCPQRASCQCEFTRMLSDNAPEGTSPRHSLNINHTEAVANPTNTGSRNEIDPFFTAHLPSTAMQGPVNIMKRTPPAMENDDPQLLPSQKRAKIIEAALRGSAQDSSSTSMQEAQGRSNSRPHSDDGVIPTTFPDPIPALPNLFGADTPDMTDTQYQEVRAETIEFRLSERVNDSSQSIGISSGKMDPSSLGGLPSSRAVNTDKTWLLHTPKRTEFERSTSMTSVLSTPGPSPVKTSKGKQRANEEWCKEKAVVSPEESPSKRCYSAASVTHTLEGLSGLPNYLRVLEKDQEIKDMKIKHLENEVQRLKSRQGELEKLVHMYERHSSMIDHGV